MAEQLQAVGIPGAYEGALRYAGNPELISRTHFALFLVEVGACNFIAETGNANFYFYGDTLDGSGRAWQGSHSLCVEYPGPYTFYSTSSTVCSGVSA